MKARNEALRRVNRKREPDGRPSALWALSFRPAAAPRTKARCGGPAYSINGHLEWKLESKHLPGIIIVRNNGWIARVYLDRVTSRGEMTEVNRDRWKGQVQAL